VVKVSGQIWKTFILCVLFNVNFGYILKGEVGGHIRASGNLSFVMVQNASHETVGYKPEKVWILVTPFSTDGNGIGTRLK